MRLGQSPPTLLSLLFVVLSHPTTTKASPLFRNLGFSFLHGRQSGNCGADLQYTCSEGQGCFTANNIAYCSATANSGSGGGYAVYTTTYTETDLLLRTSTYTSSWAAAATSTYVAPTTTGAAQCGAQEASCGKICCASNQGCSGGSSCTELASTLWSYTAMPNPTVTSTYSSASAPLRPTSGASTLTTTTSASTTVPFLSPATASGSTLPITEHSTGGGLSGGAIAGIVIGVIAAIIILILICFCCILKAGFDGLLALFGLGKRRRTEKIETTERYSRHGSTASRRNTHSGWFGASKPARVDSSRKNQSSGLGGMKAVGAGLLGLAVVLGLKRRHDKKERVARTEVSSDYYSYTDSYTGTSASSASSDRRTRDSRRTRDTRR